MKLLLSISLIFILSQTLFAADEKRGQKYYLENCSSCHGAGNRGGGLANTREWKNYFKDEAKMLKSMHNEKDSKIAVEYLKSEKFKKEQKRMLKFLIEFAKDSHKIPSCNN